MKFLTATCATEIDKSAPEWVHLLPLGIANPRDARAPWTVSNASAIIAATKARNLDPVIDFDHQTEYAKSNGQPAPAAGWIKELAARIDGVWGRVDWTPKARAMIEAGEYRYLSPTFGYAQASREVGIIYRAALTNNPALHLTAIASNEDHEDSMDEVLKALAAALGLAEDSDKATVLAKVNEKIALATAQTSLITGLAAKLGVKADATAEAFATALAAVETRSGAEDNPDLAKFVPMADYQKLSTDFAALRGEVYGAKAGDKVDAACKAGQITPAQREWAMGLAASDPEAFDAFLKNQPVIVKPGDSNTGGRNPDDAPATLTDSDKAVCSAMGLDPEKFKEARNMEVIEMGAGQ